MRDSDPHGQRLPIKLDSTSNGVLHAEKVYGLSPTEVKHCTAGDREAQIT